MSELKLRPLINLTFPQAVKPFSGDRLACDLRRVQHGEILPQAVDFGLQIVDLLLLVI